MIETAATVEDLCAGWQFMPPVQVVASPAHLPVPAPDDARGLYWRNRVWLVEADRDGMTNAMAHEVIGHHAPRVLLGREWAGFMSAIREGILTGDPKLVRLAEHVRRSYEGSDLSLRGEADEILARLAEISTHPVSGAIFDPPTVKQRVKAVLAHAGRKYLHMGIPATAGEAHSVLFEGQELIRRGRPLWARSAWWYPAQMPQPSKPMGPKVPARSLRESEQLLASEKQWQDTKDGYALLGRGLLFLGCVAIFIVGFIVTTDEILAWLSR